MVEVIFIFDKEKDLWNCWDKSNFKSSFGNFQTNSRLKNICKGKSFKDCKNELSDYLLKLHDSLFLDITLKSAKEAWKIIEEEFFNRMDFIMDNKFNENIFAYLTTLGICPYDPDEPSFMFSLFYSLPQILQVSGHEIMHLYFHKFYFKKVEKFIGLKKTSDLKEALTVLLNLEFKDLWFVQDFGYEPHKELRQFIVQEWKKDKNMKKLLDKCIDYLK